MEEEVGRGGVEEEASLALAMMAREVRGLEGGGRGWEEKGGGREG